MKKLFGFVFLVLFLTGCALAQAEQAVEWLELPEELLPEEVSGEDFTRFGEETELNTDFNYYSANLQAHILDNDEFCNTGMNLGSATTQITYRDENRGIQFTFPYNETWVRSPLPHSDVHYEFLDCHEADCLRFGPIGTVDGCSMPQFYFLKFWPTEYSKTGITKEPTEKVFNGLSFFEYETLSIADSAPAIQLRGDLYTYEFYPLSGDSDELQVLEWIAETVELF